MRFLQKHFILILLMAVVYTKNSVANITCNATRCVIRGTNASYDLPQTYLGQQITLFLLRNNPTITTINVNTNSASNATINSENGANITNLNLNYNLILNNLSSSNLNIGSINVTGNRNLNINGGTTNIGNVSSGSNFTLNLDSAIFNLKNNLTAANLNVSGDSTEITIDGTLSVADFDISGDSSTIDIKGNANITNLLNISGDSSTINMSGMNTNIKQLDISGDLSVFNISNDIEITDLNIFADPSIESSRANINVSDGAMRVTNNMVVDNKHLQIELTNADLTIENLEMKAKAKIEIAGDGDTNITNLNISGDSTEITIDGTLSVADFDISGDSSTINLLGDVDITNLLNISGASSIINMSGTNTTIKKIDILGDLTKIKIDSSTIAIADFNILGNESIIEIIGNSELTKLNVSGNLTNITIDGTTTITDFDILGDSSTIAINATANIDNLNVDGYLSTIAIAGIDSNITNMIVSGDEARVNISGNNTTLTQLDISGDLSVFNISNDIEITDLNIFADPSIESSRANINMSDGAMKVGTMIIDNKYLQIELTNADLTIEGLEMKAKAKARFSVLEKSTLAINKIEGIDYRDVVGISLRSVGKDDLIDSFKKMVSQNNFTLIEKGGDDNNVTLFFNPDDGDEICKNCADKYDYSEINDMIVSDIGLYRKQWEIIAKGNDLFLEKGEDRVPIALIDVSVATKNIAEMIENNWNMGNETNEQIELLAKLTSLDDKNQFFRALSEITPDASNFNLRMIREALNISSGNINKRLAYFRAYKFGATYNNYNIQRLLLQDVDTYDDFYDVPYSQNNLWYESFAGVLREDEKNIVPGYDTKYGGITLGYDVRPTHFFILGTSYTFNFLSTETDEEPGETRDNVETYSNLVNLYAMLYEKNKYITIEAGGGYNINQQERTINFDKFNKTALSKYASKYYYGKTEVGLNISLFENNPPSEYDDTFILNEVNEEEKLSRVNPDKKSLSRKILGSLNSYILFSPHIALQYDEFSFDEYTEENADAANLTIKINDIETLSTKIGGDLVFSTAAGVNSDVQFVIGGNITKRLKENQMNVVGKFVDRPEGEHFSFDGPEQNDIFYDVSAKLNANIYDTTAFTISYTKTFAERMVSHHFSTALTLSF